MDAIINDIFMKMLSLSSGNLHDIEHFIKVHSYAKLIGRKELSSPRELEVLEVAAIMHDIACPLCREKYSSAKGELQESEGMILCREFLKDFKLDVGFTERVIWLVGHHHTFGDNISPDHRILLEADLLVNASEGNYPPERLEQEAALTFRTKTGLELYNIIYKK